MKKRKTACLLLAGAVLLAGLTACNSYPQPERLTTYAMGSVVQQTVYGEGRHTAAADAAQAVQELENLISWRVENSTISTINQLAGKWVSLAGCDRERNILETALEIRDASGGAFTPAIGPVSRLWDFDGDPHVPDPEELSAALALVDDPEIRLEWGWGYQSILLTRRGMALDLGAVGKGAACDAALAEYRSSERVVGAVIAVGGSVAVCGQKPDGAPWQVAVRDPKSDGALGEIEMNSGYVSTSGSYEKTFTEDGKTYHHILDPRTGYPAESGLVSVTVWMPSVTRPILADHDHIYSLSPELMEILGTQEELVPVYNGSLTDALSTACFVLGLADSLPLLEKYGAEGIFITEDDAIYCTDGMRESFTLDETKGYTLREDLP